MTVAAQSAKQKYPVQQVLGVSIAAMRMAEVLDVVSAAVESHSKLHIGVVNAAKVVNMHRDPALGEDVLSSDVVLADGAAVVWASKLLGKSLPERVAGIDLMHRIMGRASERGWRVFCLGATDEVLAKSTAAFREMYPGAVLAGSRNGYFKDEEAAAVAQQIRDSRADILFVAITSPKKERFMAKWNAVMDVPVVHGVGGSFDVVAGKVKRAPEMWQKLGLEWLYRVKQEPGRLWKRYAVTNTIFTWMLCKEWMRTLLGGEAR